MSSLKRRLAAIVFTDIVGFTNLSSKDEEGAYKLVVMIKGNLISP